MLELINIRKVYGKDEAAVEALKGVSLKFRKNEFVSILGQSGCGKTTMLNIIGGLDQYTSGDLIINGVSTKNYKDADWDTYRNHSIGFIFQSYNLIPHQTVLANVELALTLSGISKNERRKRAIQALETVGLGDQINKRPNQLSGGQMQRVAIARALINNPEILLADEPTGALDSDTSVQVMDLLKEIARDRLVIMVTHNPELAEEYSTRIINLRDGNLVGDSMPYESDDSDESKTDANTEIKGEIIKKKKASMSFMTAMSLSFNNLMTKKGRTFLTSFAGSIGIIGIALILAVSTGVNAYIKSIEESTMASYPLQIYQSTMNSSAVLSSFMQGIGSNDQERDPDKIYGIPIMVQMMTSMNESTSMNNLEKFKDFLDNNREIQEYSTDIKYSYSVNLNTYLRLEDGTYTNSSLGMYKIYSAMQSNGYPSEITDAMSSMMYGMGDVSGWTELLGSKEEIMQSYDLVDGRYPESNNEIVLIVDENNQISDYTLYVLGIRDYSEIEEYIQLALESYINGTDVTFDVPEMEYTFEEIYSYQFKILLDSDNYIYENGKIRELDIYNNTEDQKILRQRLDNAKDLKIVGILRPNADNSGMASIGTIGYMSNLIDEVIDDINSSEVVQKQLTNPGVDMFTGIKFDSVPYTMDDFPDLKFFLSIMPNYSTGPMLDFILEKLDLSYLKPIISKYVPTDADSLGNMILDYLNKDKITTNTYEENLEKLGYVNKDIPDSISIYPKDFESKEKINAIIADYNSKQSEDDKITYTDTVALLMSSVTTIVDAISYVLIAFVAISLVVSSIMIGIITYISVLERTKEIGILRAIGASKRDIGRVFNAETIFVGLVAGIIGIVASLGLTVVINMILYHFTQIATLKAVLNPGEAIILIIVSVGLTYVAGLVPSKTASNKDPVIALRSE